MLLRRARAILVIEFPNPKTSPLPCTYWSSDWDAATPPRYVVAFGAIVVPEGLDKTCFWRRWSVGGGTLVGARGTLTAPAPCGQADKTETSADTKEKLLQTARADFWKLQKVTEQQERQFSQTQKKDHPEFLVQEKVQSGGTESSQRGSVLLRNTRSFA